MNNLEQPLRREIIRAFRDFTERLKEILDRVEESIKISSDSEEKRKLSLRKSLLITVIDFINNKAKEIFSEPSDSILKKE